MLELIRHWNACWLCLFYRSGAASLLLPSAGGHMRRLWRGLEPLYIVATLALLATIAGLAIVVLLLV